MHNRNTNYAPNSWVSGGRLSCTYAASRMASWESPWVSPKTTGKLINNLRPSLQQSENKKTKDSLGKLFLKAEYQSQSKPYVDAARCVWLRSTSRTSSFKGIKSFIWVLGRIGAIATQLQRQPHQVKVSPEKTYTPVGTYLEEKSHNVGVLNPATLPHYVLYVWYYLLALSSHPKDT